MEEISEWFNGFKEAHPTGYVTMEEFKNIYRDLFEDGNPDEVSYALFEFVFRNFKNVSLLHVFHYSLQNECSGCTTRIVVER